MKYTLVLLFACLAFLAAAQSSEGVIVFEEKINMHRSLPPDAADMRAMIPEWRTARSELLFSATASLYRNLPEEEEDEEPGGGVQIRMQRPEATFFRDFEAGLQVDQREFMGKMYLIEDSLRAPGWKITGETKTILGYNCLKATRQDTIRQRTIAAWFTDAIPAPSGPTGYGQLPGMILEIDVNNGEMINTAVKTDFRPLKKNDLAAPKKGEKISDVDFQKLVAERMRQNGGGPIRVIRN